MINFGRCARPSVRAVLFRRPVSAMKGTAREIRGISCPNEQLHTVVTGRKGTEKAAPRKARRTVWPGPDSTIHLRVLRRSFLTQVATDTTGCHSELDSESPRTHLTLSRRFRIGVRNEKQRGFLIGTTEAGCQVRKSFPAVSGRGTPRPYVNPFAAPTRTVSTRTIRRSNVKRLTLNPEPSPRSGSA